MRGRKDLVLCQRARDRRRRFYGTQKFTPEQARRWDGLAPWQNARIFHGGNFRTVRCKEVNQVCWQGGAKKQPLRLLVRAATGYRQSKNGRR